MYVESSKALTLFNKQTIDKPALPIKGLNRMQSIENPKNYPSLKNFFYQHEKLRKLNIDQNLPILSEITKFSDNKSSVMTRLSDKAPVNFIYNSTMIKKYEEDLNSSLSFISEFDLEGEEKKLNDSFSSSDSNDNVEEIEIKTSKRATYPRYDEENEKKLEQEWNDIQELLLKKQ